MTYLTLRRPEQHSDTFNIPEGLSEAENGIIVMLVLKGLFGEEAFAQSFRNIKQPISDPYTSPL